MRESIAALCKWTIGAIFRAAALLQAPRSVGGVASGSIASGTNAFSIPSGRLFQASDVGKLIRAVGAAASGGVHTNAGPAGSDYLV